MDRLAERGRGLRVERLRDRFDTGTAGYLALGAGAGLAVFLIAVFVFPYHSVNHDEGVYLMQASMLLEGQLTLSAGELADVFRPWFFIENGGDLYSKYNPVPAAMFAVSMALFGEPRVTLAAVAGGNAVLVAVLGSMVADRRVGLLAGGLFAISPMTLFTSSVFLPYAPTTLLNLSFAVAYLHGVRTGSLRAAAAAGIAIGLAAFSRPYTAILFAAPFILHAVWTVGRGLWTDDRSLGQQARLLGSRAGVRSLPNAVQRNILTGIGGTAFVGITLAYNTVLTGDPLVFPYQAFAPLDGPGFGFREILGHEVVYTLDLALESNRYALQFLGTRWFAGGVIGTLAAALGLLVAAQWWRGRDREWGSTAGLPLAGLFVSVPIGNIPFWGTHNMLAELDDPANGLVSHFGPFYYFDLLVPLSIFAALGLVVGWRWLRGGGTFDRLIAATSPTAARRIAVAVALVAALAVGGVTAGAVAEPLDRNMAYTEKYETVYEPIESTDFENALVFIPDPYGPWQNHPFQSLRNDPGFDGEVVYARDRDPAGNFEVLAAYPNRSVYRFAYRGVWTPEPDQFVSPKLESLSTPTGESLTGETRVGVADRVGRATVTIEADGETVTRDIDAPDETISANWTLENGSARLVSVNGTAVTTGNTSITIDATENVGLRITLVDTGGNTYTYQQWTAVQSTPAGLQAVTPAERRVCRLTTDCDPEDAYLPDDPTAHPEWATFETDVSVAG
ncbi:hypothetical protein EGH24_08880 [Halonotius terrestris]|uniref:DUF7846 domain-containing protein n=1 Tax=Halonotius terrestris TaxID=2487750 RepID=A0A8J8PC49_9EURY|nr:hypothetical protein EGH24_08880 [Halonotius terrestris]